jgi:caffeoyl-CoA O-methyltransferase
MTDQTAEYIAALFAPEDYVLGELREEAASAGLPAISSSADTGRLLQVLLGAIRARRVLEVGTLGGYSAIWMARALPADGKLLSLEINPDHARFAQRHVERAGLVDRVEIRTGPALDLLPALEGQRFDAMFIDADKESYVAYLDWGLRLVRPGGLVIADNALWGGSVFDDGVHDEKTEAVRAFNQRIAAESRLTSIIVPTHDGVAISVVD